MCGETLDSPSASSVECKKQWIFVGSLINKEQKTLPANTARFETACLALDNKFFVRFQSFTITF